MIAALGLVWICYARNAFTGVEFSAWHESESVARNGAMNRCYEWSGEADTSCELDPFPAPPNGCKLIPRPKTDEGYEPDFGEPLMKP